MFFMDQFHIDGLRVDAVTSILYLDYARDGYFVPNEDGGNIDNHAVEMLRRMNSVVLTNYAGTMTIAEESTAYPMITDRLTMAGWFTFLSGTWALCTIHLPI